MNYSESPEFAKEFKKLSKKYRSLPQDMAVFKKNVIVVDLCRNKNFAVITRNNCLLIVKARLACRYLKRNTLRVVYAFNKKENNIEFIEIYFKGHKENEDRKRINDYLKSKMLL